MADTKSKVRYGAPKQPKVQDEVSAALAKKQREMKEIEDYRKKYPKVEDTRPLKSLTTYGKPVAPASGGSQSVRKIAPDFEGKTTPARTDDGDLVDRLRRHPASYFKK